VKHDAPTLAGMSILLQGGRVIDPASATDVVADVLVEGGVITAIGSDLAATHPGAEVVDVRGKLVTPGLIDLHVHVFPGLGDFCLPPDRVGVETGVPVVVDGGTSGATTFEVSRRAHVDHPETRTRVLCFMDPCQIYLANKGFVCHHLRIADDERNIDLKVTRAVLDRNRDLIVGFKVRACHTGDPTVSPFLEAAKKLAGDELPIMVHLGRFPKTPTIPTSTLLEALRGGDIITHAFRGASGVLEKGKITPQFRAALDRGVRLDIGHSGTDFRFRDARKIMDQGVLPHTISTDLNVFNVDGPVYDLATTMSKIWHLGVDLVDVIAMATTGPAASIRRSDELGVLAPGRVAEVSVLAIDDDGPYPLSDGWETVEAERRLRAVGCLRAGAWYPVADHAIQPEAVLV
jgi:dihydroorotase